MHTAQLSKSASISWNTDKKGKTLSDFQSVIAAQIYVGTI